MLIPSVFIRARDSDLQHNDLRNIDKPLNKIHTLMNDEYQVNNIGKIVHHSQINSNLSFFRFVIIKKGYDKHTGQYQ